MKNKWSTVFNQIKINKHLISCYFVASPGVKINFGGKYDLIYKTKRKKFWKNEKNHFFQKIANIKKN